MIEWTKEDSEKALAEGWDVFRCHGETTYHDIQRHDEAEVFAEDVQAIAHVYWMATHGSELHRKALEYVLQQSSAAPAPKPISYFLRKQSE